MPARLFADPRAASTARGAARAFGDGGGLNANQHCPATGGTLGDAKGLDLWTYFPSQQTATWLDVLPDLRRGRTTPARPRSARRSWCPPPGVLTNDVRRPGGELTVLSSTAPAHGTVTTNADGSFTYTPTAGYTGPDQFDYTSPTTRGGPTSPPCTSPSRRPPSTTPGRPR